MKWQLGTREVSSCHCAAVKPVVARALVGVQADVVRRHGFEGDAGYAQAQVCLMEHAADAVVTASIAAATTNIYARAGINLQEALRQAAGGG